MNIRNAVPSNNQVVRESLCVSKRPTANKGTLAALIALPVLVFGARDAAAAPNCNNGQAPPNMTIQIYNNSTTDNIYPVLFAGAASKTDTWLQACFQLTEAQLASNPFPRAMQYRMYINCCGSGENGIPPGASVTITLPLYSPLVASINPKVSGQLIDWWQGGGINFYRAPMKSTTPPAVLKQHWDADENANAITPASNPPTCNGCMLHFFKAPASIPNSDPQQLTEHTLGAEPLNPRRALPGQPARLWVSNNVDYDVSYVNYVYMPAVMEPFGNHFIGYIGSPIALSDFDTASSKWYKSDLGAGWPLYNGPGGGTVSGKFPSALEIFLNTAAFENTNVFTPAPSKSTPIMAMTKEWNTCVHQNGTDKICPLINRVTALLNANYANYKRVGTLDRHTWTQVWGCTGDPVDKTDQLILAHLYGWTPIVVNCTNTGANQLYNTPGYENPNRPLNYEAVKADFDELQYWVNVLQGDYGQFDPYVALIHGPDYLNAPYTYAYSVDDAVGNMQTDGTGLIIAVGGTQNLPNQDHATPNVNFPFGLSSPYDGGIRFELYGRCTTTPDTAVNPDFTSFAVPEGIDNTKSSIVNCTNSLKDSRRRTYLFRLKHPPNFSTGFPKNPDPTPKERMDANDLFIDCTGNTGQVLNWCHTIYPYQVITPNNARAAVNYVVTMGGPPPLH